MKDDSETMILYGIPLLAMVAAVMVVLIQYLFRGIGRPQSGGGPPLSVRIFVDRGGGRAGVACSSPRDASDRFARTRIQPPIRRAESLAKGPIADNDTIPHGYIDL